MLTNARIKNVRKNGMKKKQTAKEQKKNDDN